MGGKHIGAVAGKDLDRGLGGNLGHQRLVPGLADHRRCVAFEVGGMDDPSGRRVDDDHRGFGDRMADRQELHGEGADARLGGARLDGGDGVLGQTRLFKFQPAKGGGKFAGIDRLFQHRPQMRQRAKVVFMGVGDDDAIQPVHIIHQPGYVGHDHVDAGAAVHIRESDAQIDQQKPLLAGTAIAIDISVHTDFPGTAERKIDEAFACHQTVSLLYWLIRTRPCMVRSSSTE